MNSIQSVLSLLLIKETCLLQLLKKDEHGNYNKGALSSCRQIVNCLVEHVLRLEETSMGRLYIHLLDKHHKFLLTI